MSQNSMTYEELRDALKSMVTDLSYEQVSKLDTILNDRMTAEQIRAMGDIEFDCPSFYGLEFRGLLGDVVKSVEMTKKGGSNYHVTCVIRATCVRTGIANREVVFDGPLTIDDSSDMAVAGVPLTDEQMISFLVIKHLINHEIEEDLRINGIPLRNPVHDLSGLRLET